MTIETTPWGAEDTNRILMLSKKIRILTDGIAPEIIKAALGAEFIHTFIKANDPIIAPLEVLQAMISDIVAGEFEAVDPKDVSDGQ